MRVEDAIAYAVQNAGLDQGSRDAISADVYSYALDSLNRIVEKVWTSYGWRDLQEIAVEVTSGDGGVVVLPRYVDRISKMYVTDYVVHPMSRPHILDLSPKWLDANNAGTVQAWHHMPEAAVLAQPAAATTLEVLSTSASDTTQAVRIKGIVNGEEDVEELTLNGTSAVESSKSFGEIRRVFKESTTGRVTVRETGGDDLAIMDPWDDRSAYRRLQLVPQPTEATGVVVIASRRFERLVSDNDVLLPDNASTCILEFLVAELQRWRENEQAAQTWEARAAESVSLAKKREQAGDVNERRVVPRMSMWTRR